LLSLLSNTSIPSADDDDDSSTPLPATSKSQKQKPNKNHYILATASPLPTTTSTTHSSTSKSKAAATAKLREAREAEDAALELRGLARQVPGVPILYLKRSVLILEPLSESSDGVRRGVERGKVRGGLLGKRKREREDEDDDRARETETQRARGLVNNGLGDGQVEVEESQGVEKRKNKKKKEYGFHKSKKESGKGGKPSSALKGEKEMRPRGPLKEDEGFFDDKVGGKNETEMSRGGEALGGRNDGSEGLVKKRKRKHKSKSRAGLENGGAAVEAGGGDDSDGIR